MSSQLDRRMAVMDTAGLYVVTSESLSAGRTTLEVVAAALEGGVRLFQLREKELPLRALLTLGHELRELTQRYEALLLVNDRIDVALAIGADGVHLGQADMPIEVARRLGPDLIIGSSSHDVTEAREAAQAGASYVNIGPIYPTQTKQWDDAYLGLEGLREIAAEIQIPFTVMGGIKAAHIPGLCEAGARTLAVVTAVTAASDPAMAALHLREAILSARGD
jgi:thiamine-phosphate pyrophosphorylase